MADEAYSRLFSTFRLDLLSVRSVVARRDTALGSRAAPMTALPVLAVCSHPSMT
jgi:hypothetical protein